MHPTLIEHNVQLLALPLFSLPQSKCLINLQVAFGKSCYTTEKIQATLLALQRFIKFKRSNTDTNDTFSALCDNFFERYALFETI